MDTPSLRKELQIHVFQEISEAKSVFPDDFKVVSKGCNGLNDIYSEFEGMENEVWSPTLLQSHSF